MSKKYNITKKSCRTCGGLISFEDYPNPKWPIHVDANGYIIGDGSCPDFKKGNNYNKEERFIFFQTKEYKRYDIDSTLPIFQDKIPHLTRFLIGKVLLEFSVNLKLIKIKNMKENDSLYIIANKLIRKLFYDYNIVSFFKIQETSQQDMINLFILNKITMDNKKVMEIVEESIEREVTLINENLNENIKLVEYA